jgi:chorismate mutase
MTLEEARKQIDAIDPQIRELLMKRFDCGYQVANAKFADHSTTVFRADREAAILAKLGKDVPDERRAQYLAVVKKIMEANRMYQYGLLYEWNGEEAVFTPLAKNITIIPGGTLVNVRLTRADQPNGISTILGMIGDYGYNLEAIELTARDKEKQTATFDITIQGDLSQVHMKKLMFQLSRESEDFQILENK